MNGNAGIEKAIKHIPDLIVSDVMLPEKNGFEIWWNIKNKWNHQSYSFHFVNRQSFGRSKIEGLETGADDYITKPLLWKNYRREFPI